MKVLPRKIVFLRFFYVIKILNQFSFYVPIVNQIYGADVTLKKVTATQYIKKNPTTWQAIGIPDTQQTQKKTCFPKISDKKVGLRF